MLAKFQNSPLKAGFAQFATSIPWLKVGHKQSKKSNISDEAMSDEALNESNISYD